MELSLEFETEAFRAWTEAAIADMDDRGSREFLRNTAFAFLERVIPKMPVDTGRARAGWSSYLIANALPQPQYGPDPKGVAEGRAQSSFSQDLRGKEKSIVLVNAVHYAVVLEFGSSKQAPAGFVRTTFRELRARGVVTRELRQQLRKTVLQANRTARARVRRVLPG